MTDASDPNKTDQPILITETDRSLSPPLSSIESEGVLPSDPAASSAETPPSSSITNETGSEPADNSFAARKVRQFPRKPGVYLMKDAAGRVIYIGKAKNLRNRAGSYFLKAAAVDPRTAQLVKEIRDIEFMEAESEIDALLVEARLIKDILPRFNRDLRDSKTFPYLEITLREDYPRVGFTREPQSHGSKLYGPFGSPRQLRGAIQVLQKIFQFRTCTLEIDEKDPRWRWFRPCLLASIEQCSAPCNLRISKEEYRKRINRLRSVLEGNKAVLLREMRNEMAEASKKLQFEKAGRLRDEIEMLESLEKRGGLLQHVQPEVFPIDPRKGLAGLQKIFHLETMPRTLEGIDIAHIQGKETVASLVQFIDGLPFKPGYKRMRIRSVEGVDDYAAIFEAVSRRLRHQRDSEIMPDILLIDGGKGQLHAAMNALQLSERQPKLVLSLAKKDELVFTAGRDLPLKLSRHSYALRLLQYIRDEAHRFAQHYHHILRRRTTFGDK